MNLIKISLILVAVSLLLGCQSSYPKQWGQKSSEGCPDLSGVYEDVGFNGSSRSKIRLYEIIRLIESEKRDRAINGDRVSITQNSYNLSFEGYADTKPVKIGGFKLDYDVCRDGFFAAQTKENKGFNFWPEKPRSFIMFKEKETNDLIVNFLEKKYGNATLIPGPMTSGEWYRFRLIKSDNE